MTSRTLAEIDYPKTKDEWWALADYHKSGLMLLMAHYHPSQRRIHRHPITAPLAERVCERIRDQIRYKTNADPLARAELSYAERSIDLLDLLNETWFGMPESMGVRSDLCFGVLCDLCSEGHVLQDQGEIVDGECSSS